MLETGDGLLKVAQVAVDATQFPVGGRFGAGVAQLVGHDEAFFEADLFQEGQFLLYAQKRYM